MHFITINGDKVNILWDYGVIIDTADELGFEYVDDVFSILREYLPEKDGEVKKIKVKTVKQMAVLANNMVKAAGGEVDSRKLLNSLIEDPMNMERIIAEVISKTPSGDDKKKVGESD